MNDESTPSRRRGGPSLAAAALLLFARLAAAAPAPLPDPVEGKWRGEVGFPQDRVALWLDFERNAKGEMHGYMYLPIANFYGLDLGAVTREGAKYRIEDSAISLDLGGGKLEGTFYPLNAPASFARTGALPAESPVPDLPPGPGPRWRAKLGAAIYAPAAVREGIAYVGTTGGLLYAVRVSDGSFVWSFVAGRPLHGAALATDDHLFFVCDNGYLFELDRRTGKEIWRYDLGDARVSRPLPHQVLDELGIGHFDFDTTAPRPLLADGVLYVGSGDGSFHAVDAATGRRIWRFDPPENAGPPPSTPWNPEGSTKIRSDAVLDGPRVIFGSFGHRLRALDRATGKEVWSKDSHAEFTGSPAIVGGRLIAGTRGGALYALDPATGEVAWRMLFWGSAVESTPVPGEGSLFYIGSSDMRRVSLIDAKDGRVLWRTDVYGWAWARPAVTDRFVFASAGGADPYQMRHLGSLCAIDRATGKIAWRWPMPAWPGSWMNGFVAPPVVDGETVVVGGLDGTLYGFPAR